MPSNGPLTFNKKAAEKLQSPDDLDKYVRVTNPGIWMVLAACIILLAGLTIWGFFGTVSTSVVTEATLIDGKITLFATADEQQQMRVGDGAIANGSRLEIESIDAYPMSRDEASELLNSDYLAWRMVKDEWVYKVVLYGSCNGARVGAPVSVTVTTQKMTPVSLIM